MSSENTKWGSWPGLERDPKVASYQAKHVMGNREKQTKKEPL